MINQKEMPETFLQNLTHTTKGGGLRPLEPPLSRAKPAAAAIRRTRYRQFRPFIMYPKAFTKAAGVQTPLSASHPSDAHAARVCFALGSPRHLAMQPARDSAVVVWFQARFSRPAARHALRQFAASSAFGALRTNVLRGISVSVPLDHHAASLHVRHTPLVRASTRPHRQQY